MPVEDKARLADFVIDNNGTLDNTEKQVQRLYDALKVSRFHWVVRLVFLTGVALLLLIFSGVLAFFRWLL